MSLQFDEKKHEYSVDGEVYTSVTQLLSRHGLGVDYSDVPLSILERAKEFGNTIHNEIEKYIKGEGVIESLEVKKAIELLEQNDIIITNSEQRLSNNEYRLAGTLDLLGIQKDLTVLIDIKTTSTLYREYLSWQLSLYEFLLGERVDKFYCLWINKGEVELVEIDRVDVQDLLSVHLLDIKYLPTVISERHVYDLQLLNQDIEVLKAELKELETKQKTIQNAILKVMRDNKIRQFKNDDIQITYTAPHERVRYDYKQLLENKGIEVSEEELESVKKVSKVKDRIRITYRS